MKQLMKLIVTGTVVCVIASVSYGASSASRSLTVVELFTSQGCSSCPPANANLIKLSKRDDVLTLSFAVTYWDYLGWKDSFGKREFTDRQIAYEAPLHQPGPFTPQMVVNGAKTVVGNNLAELTQLLATTSRLTGPSVALGQSSAQIGRGDVRRSVADVWLVRYDPNVVNVPIARGENAGSTLPHTHVVRALTRLGQWDGNPATFDFSKAPNGLRTAILLQEQQGGPILAAATD
ncbi:hypothetical protein RHSP_31266 [Rhizobium freirei PRF 81]|uniref:DUF1223 domain-containing protein n=1 Tax=Rhizobium freirei PRF 81 TaxID=363754 RepID=N6U2E9_9HYPH|nr:DUF1223 domain-containing protein [Rhizobium freirei]ENN86814.1 hypothetical protein RHSP_31266 [Rhizobium freirei PRF 81]